ncbi:MAG: FAD-dependent oxidoreductase [Eubacterium sp.]|nr:FAD-dependent oxidoreductase [Eubacterium sp.]
MTLTIDGRKVTAPAGQTVLQAALDNGIYIPHLCSHENLHPAGACRLCVAACQGVDGVITTCTEKVKEGMVVDTHDETAEKIRKLSCDLMFKTHPSECTGCPKYGKCQLQSISQYVGDTGRRLKANTINVKADTGNPIILHEMYRCILCGRCVRACKELRGVGAIRFAETDGRMRVVIDGDSLKDAGCRFCTACVEVCPTGSIREHQQLADKLVGKTREEGFVPCRSACPAHVDVPRYIRFIKEGNYAAAAAVVREKVPFPHALGYICVHNCELECKRNELNDPISIRNLKRYAAQQDDGAWRQKAVQKPATGKKLAVVGAGAAGLTAAYYGAKLGHSVTVFEAMPLAGGQMRYGIPNYRLPREALDAEIREILGQDAAAGIQVKYNTAVENAPQLLKQGFDAVFVAIGTHAGTKLPIPGNDLEGVFVNVDFLRAFEEGTAAVGGHVVILGGGNVAVDCAGAALRLGAESVSMACLEAYDKMTATEEERAWAQEEGVRIYNSKTFHEILGDADGHCTGVRIQGIEKFYFDENRKAHMELAEGTEEVLKADTVIFAVGQRPTISSDPAVFGLELTHGNYIDTKDASGATSVPGVWAAGDVVTGTQSVIKAIAAAREAVRAIDQYLGGSGAIDETLAPEQYKDPHIGVIEHFGDKERVKPRVVPVPQRVTQYRTCGPMDQGFDKEMATCEASRCLQCDLRCELAPQKFWSDYVSEPGKEVGKEC